MTEGRRIGEGRGVLLVVFISSRTSPMSGGCTYLPSPHVCPDILHSRFTLALAFPFLSKQTIKLSPHNTTHSRSNLTCAEKRFTVNEEETFTTDAPFNFFLC